MLTRIYTFHCKDLPPGSLPEAPPVAVEHSDVVVIAIIPVSKTSDDLVEVIPI